MPAQYSMFRNPDTGRVIKEGAATWRRLTARGYRVVGDRLLRPEHADVEARGIELGHPLNLPTNVTSEQLAAAMSNLRVVAQDRVRVTDEEYDKIFDDLYDLVESPAGVISWTSRTPRDYAADRIPELVGATFYTFEVGVMLYTFPSAAEGPALAALEGADITPARVNAISDLFEGEEQTFALSPVETTPQVTDDGEVIFRSFEQIRLEQNGALPRAVVAALNPARLYSLYGVFGYHDGHGAPVEFIDNLAVPQPLHDRRKRLVEQFRGDTVTVGALEGIDTTRWEQARGYLALIRWRLTPIPDVAGPMGPFHTGDLGNCVLKVVRDLLESDKLASAPAGKKLAARRLAALAALDVTMASAGFTLADAERLERACEIRLRCLDVAGNDLLPRPPATGRAARHQLVNVTLHDHHGWAQLPVDPPKIERILAYDDETERALALSSKLLDSEKAERASTKALLDFVSKEVPQGTRMWMCGSEIITHRGELYRTQCAARAIDDALGEHTGFHPRDFDPHSAIAKLDGITVCETLTEFDQATNSIGGATAYKFHKWLERENIKPTPVGMRDIWQHAQVEAVVWHSPVDESSSPHYHIDMRAAYLACDRRENRANSDAASEIHRYGFPTNLMRLASLDTTRPLDVNSPALALTGTIQLVEWTFGAHVHPFTPWRVGNHLREHQGWITTPELRDLLESGDLVHAAARQIVYSVGANRGLKFPSSSALTERTQAVTFVGKLARHADESSLITRDANEAAYLAGAFGKAGRYLSHASARGSAHLVRYKSERTRAQWFHVRAFVLAYTNIALRRMLRRFDPSSVIRINTDAIFALGTHPPASVQLSTDETTIKWGEWRLKPPGYTYHQMRDTPAFSGRLELGASDAPPLVRDPHDCTGVDASAVPAELTGTLLANTRRLLITGQGGCGKTYVISKALAGSDFVIVTPSNELAIEHADKLGCRTSTFHKLLALPVGKPMSEWKPELLGHKLDHLPRTIVWDEAGMVPDEVFKVIDPYLDSRGIQVIKVFGEGQLNPFAQKAGPAAYLRDWADVEIEFDVDVRSQDERIRDLKRRIWRTTDKEQLSVWRADMPPTRFDDALAEWHPRDLFLCSTNALGSTTAARLLEEHRRRYPLELAPIRFAPDDSVSHKYKNTKALIDVPGTHEQVRAVRGTIAWVPLDTVDVDGLPPEWQYAGWGTIHCIQGKTLSAPRRLFILDHMLDGWISNAVYTAVSRVRTYGQLRRVTPPADALGYVVPCGIQAEPSITLIEARLRRHVADDKAAKKACTVPAARLEVYDILELLAKNGGRCACCDCPLLLQGFKPRHKQAFSIDRLNDAKGHIRGNVRITCFSCNQCHKV